MIFIESFNRGLVYLKVRIYEVKKYEVSCFLGLPVYKYEKLQGIDKWYKIEFI